MTQQAVPARSRVPGPSLGVSLAVVGMGVVIGIVAVVAIVIPLVGTFTSTEYPVPGTIQLHLHHAHYTVYRYSGTRSAFGSETTDPNAPGIYPHQVTVTGADGSNVPVSFDSRIETLTRGTTRYSGALEFFPSVTGDYTLEFAQSIPPTKVIVVRSLADALKSVLAWFGVAALGGLTLVGGVVMWIVGATRRGRAKRSAYAWGNAGWGPPPYGAPPSYGPPPQPWGPPPQQWGPAPPSGPPPSGPPSAEPPPSGDPRAPGG